MKRFSLFTDGGFNNDMVVWGMFLGRLGVTLEQADRILNGEEKLEAKEVMVEVPVEKEVIKEVVKEVEVIRELTDDEMITRLTKDKTDSEKVYILNLIQTMMGLKTTDPIKEKDEEIDDDFEVVSPRVTSLTEVKISARRQRVPWEWRDVSKASIPMVAFNMYISSTELANIFGVGSGDIMSACKRSDHELNIPSTWKRGIASKLARSCADHKLDLIIISRLFGDTERHGTIVRSMTEVFRRRVLENIENLNN